MNILIFNWKDITNPWAGGAETYIHEISKRLAKKHSVTLLCGKYQGCEEESIIDGINIIRKAGRFSLYIYAPIYYLLKLRKKYDVIIDCENGIPFFTPLFIRKKIICIVHHIHKDVFDIEIPRLAWLLKALETRLMPLTYKNIQFIAVSPSTKKEMIDIGINKDNIKIVYNGLNGEFYPDWDKKKNNIIVHIGRIKKYKQLDHLVKVFRIVKDKIPSSEFVIAGRGNFDDIKKLSEQMNLRLNLYEDITENEKIDLLQKAGIFAITSMTEGWGLTVIEANRCGTPAIAYDVSGMRDSIKNYKTGILVKYGDIDGFANEIVNVLNNKDFQTELSANALDWSKNFDWNKSSEEFERFVDQFGINI